MTEFLNARPNFHVKDVARTVAFYRDKLGYTVVATMGEPANFALLENGGAQVAIGASAEVQPSGCYIYVNGVRELHDRLTAAGLNPTPLTQQPWGLLDFVVYDPDGHMLAFGERTGPAGH
jgi:catechol 2,3-dioxygenase-like lactoylglutathione lyase family enzyme